MIFPRRKQLLDEHKIDRALRREGLVPVGETSSDDIFVTGYPKSGNTWFQIMVALLVFGADAETTPFTLMLEMVPDLSERKYYKRHSARMIFKSHALPEPRHKRVVYLLRDGRDVMVSYRHYRQIVDATVYEADDFVAAPLWPCHWHEHVDAWTDNPFGADVLLVRYEDLVTDTVGQLKRFCDFAQIERSQRDLVRTACSSSFEALQNKEKREGNWHPSFTAADTFFRRGKIGSHHDELPPSALERLAHIAGPTLRRHRYI